MKKESQLTGQTELLLTQMILYKAPDWFHEVQHLDHAVAVSVGNVRLQTSKQSLVIVLKIKVFQSQFGIFNGDLPVFLWNHVKMWLLISTNRRFRDLIIAVILELCVFNLIRNLVSGTGSRIGAYPIKPTVFIVLRISGSTGGAHLGLGVIREVDQSESRGSVLVRGMGRRDRGMSSWFQTSWGRESTKQGRANSVSLE